MVWVCQGVSVAASSDAFCRDSLGCGTSAGDLYQGPMARGLLGTRGLGSVGDLWPGVSRGHVARGESGTCGRGSVGDMWHGVSRGPTARGRSGTCGPGSAGGPWPGSVGDTWPHWTHQLCPVLLGLTLFASLVPSPHPVASFCRGPFSLPGVFWAVRPRRAPFHSGRSPSLVRPRGCSCGPDLAVGMARFSLPL